MLRRTRVSTYCRKPYKYYSVVDSRRTTQTTCGYYFTVRCSDHSWGAPPHALVHRRSSSYCFRSRTTYDSNNYDINITTDKNRGAVFVRRSSAGGARRRHETVAGLLGDGERIAGTLPPMVSTKEGTLLAVEVKKKKALPSRAPRVWYKYIY